MRLRRCPIASTVSRRCSRFGRRIYPKSERRSLATTRLWSSCTSRPCTASPHCERASPTRRLTAAPARGEGGKTVTGQLLQSLLESSEVFRPTLTAPGFQNMVVIFVGWVLTGGQHAVTQALVETAVAGRRHHEAFHRFFSRGTWDPDEMAQQLLGWI